MKTRLLTIIVVSIILSFSSQDAFASCATMMPVIDNIIAFDEAEAVFVGKVLDVYNPLADGRSELELHDTITFQIDNILKGKIDDGKITSLHSSNHYGDFEVGSSYFVYAFGPKLDVSICTPPVPMPLGTPLLILHSMQGYFLLVLAAIGIVSLVIWRKRK